MHAVQLRDGLVRLVDEHQVIARKIIQQRGWRLTRQAPGEVPGIVLNAMAKTHGLDHLQIEHGALVDALGLDQAALLFQFDLPPRQLFLDRVHGRGPRFLFHDVVGLGINREARVFLLHRAKERIDLR